MADLESDESFQAVFSEAKNRVAAMGVQFLEVPDPIEQTLLEVYVAESLATPYNHWQTTEPKRPL